MNVHLRPSRGAGEQGSRGETTNTPLPSHFTLARYGFSLETLTPLELPPFKGSALRGAFGHTLKRLVCSQGCDKYCQLGNACPYGYIFETAPPQGSKVLRALSEIPRPFVIQPPPGRQSRFEPGAVLPFGLTLIGHGARFLPYFIAVFRELGHIGLGRNQGRYRLRAVEAIAPDGTAAPVYQAANEAVHTVEATLTATDLARRAATLPTGRLTLEFITPTRLKDQGRWVFNGPPFHSLIKTLLGRLSSLSYFHCGQQLEADFRSLIDRAAGVEISRSRTEWQDWSRFSGRQKQRVEMGGLVGQVTYQGDLTPYLPLLALGELVHVGKGTVFGNGQYQIITGDER